MLSKSCFMMEEIDGELYCGYYDVGCVLCDGNLDCPEEEDEEDEYQDYLDSL